MKWVALSFAGLAWACSGDTDGTAADALNGAYSNPVIPMYDRPAGVPHDVPSGVTFEPTEGCPDPQGLKTKAGEFFIYCTSYTFPYTRLNGFPVFQSHTLAGPWAPVGSIIPDESNSRAAWPKWIKDDHGNPDGSFWGPDVHELPNGKFAAEYSAPCGKERCVGIAWSDHPDGPWTHASAPFVTASNNTDVAPGGTAYDPNLLLTTSGANYLYWVVPGRGVYGVRVDYESSGKLARHAGAHVFQITVWGIERGEGPYVVEHKGGFYELFSTGSLLDGYHVGVRRSDTPDTLFTDEGPTVVQHDGHFVATGGNSLIPDAVNGKDVLVYHAIVVPSGGGCPSEDAEHGGEVKQTADNPHCRAQGERQAMIDAIDWKLGGGGHEWPALANGTDMPTHKGHL